MWAIITDAFWHSHFGGQADVIGQTISIDARSVENCWHPSRKLSISISAAGTTNMVSASFLKTSFVTPDRIRAGASYLVVITRMRAGESIADAEAELTSLNDVYRKTYPGFYDAGRYTAHAYSLKESLVGPLRTPLLVLLTAVGFVLLIGCTNLAGSRTLARATARRKEMAIRQALGLPAGRLLRQLLTESMLLSFVGGGIGLLLATNTPVLLRLLPPGTLFRVNDVRMDSRVVWFSLDAVGSYLDRCRTCSGVAGFGQYTSRYAKGSDARVQRRSTSGALTISAGCGTGGGGAGLKAE